MLLVIWWIKAARHLPAAGAPAVVESLAIGESFTIDSRVLGGSVAGAGTPEAAHRAFEAETLARSSGRGGSIQQVRLVPDDLRVEGLELEPARAGPAERAARANASRSRSMPW